MVKYLNILLIIVLIIILGSIINKIIPRKTPHIIDSNYQIGESFPNTLEESKSSDTFSIKIAARDPFLDKTTSNYSSAKKISSQSSKASKKRNGPVSKKTWPSLIYLGYVESKGNSKTALLRLNNRLLRKKTKDTFKGVTLLKIYKDSILVDFMGRDEKYFFREE